ncbi:MAG: PadR family transcriptional regulator [Streptosporangiales bacterium]|nr:PadR family transcriptional regulator [Streptosporangiales bacterium]
MSLRYALLGLLAYEPASGYALTKSFEHHVGRYAWQAGHTRIYPELNKLAADGLIEVAEEGARGRITYAITEPGRAALREWMMTPPAARKVRDEDVLRLFLMSALPPEDSRRLLKAIIEDCAGEIDELRDTIAMLDEDCAEAGERLPFGRLAAEYGLRTYETRRDWALWALARLESH